MRAGNGQAVGRHHGEAAVLDLVLLVLPQQGLIAPAEAEGIEHATCTTA